jgi:hypothetical protein
MPSSLPEPRQKRVDRVEIVENQWIANLDRLQMERKEVNFYPATGRFMSARRSDVEPSSGRVMKNLIFVIYNILMKCPEYGGSLTE